MKIGINGMGRIGRLVLRAALGGVLRDAKDQNADTRLEIVHINEISGGAETTAHLIEFDTVHGRWRANIESGKSSITIDGRRMNFSSCEKPEDIDWGAHGCDMVLECTGRFRTPKKLAGYSDASSTTDIIKSLKDEILEELVLLGGKKAYGRTKTPISTINKLRRKRLLGSKGLTDIIGTTVIAEDFSSLQQIKKAIQQGKIGTVIEPSASASESQPSYP